MTIGEVIRKYREDHNLSQRQFALKCNVSNGYISMLEKGVNPKTNEPIMPSIVALKAISSAMNISLNDLLIQADDMPVNLSLELDLQNTPKDDTIEALTKYGIRPIKLKKFPMLGEIACGQPMFCNEEFETFAEASADIDADFCLTAKGDSMINARIFDGDIVFVKKAPIVNNGEIAAVIIDDEATLKRVYYYPDKNKLILNPENPKYEPLVYINEELNHILILGRAVAFMSRVR